MSTLLTWGGESSSSEARQEPEREPFGAPPGYSASRTPLEPVRYQFSPVSDSSNSMILIPPPSSPDSRPLYHISVHNNCFMPFSYITQIRRGGIGNGDFVGEFEMGISSAAPRIFMQGQEQTLTYVIRKDSGSHLAGRWMWKRTNGVALIWSAEGGVAPYCTPQLDPKIEKQNKKNKVPEAIYAKFYYAPDIRRKTNVPNLYSLEVTPEGHEHFDEILMSALVVERQRLTPAKDYGRNDGFKVKWIFNMGG